VNSPRIAVVGANGYGAHHRRALAPLVNDRTVDLAALCDLAPIGDEPDAPVPPGTAVFTNHRAMIDNIRPDVVIVATPPHTHHDIAADAMRRGADVLVEKPPVMSMVEHESLCSIADDTGRACQVGFQALGSPALAKLGAAIGSGILGSITGIWSYGAWQRPDSYYARAPWAGKRTLNGRPVLDGALVNPFAHSLMQCFAVAEACADRGVIDEVELTLFRARDIEADDTAAVRVRLASGLTIVVAVTLCADEIADPVVVVDGEHGQAKHSYKSDGLRLPADTHPHVLPGRVNLLTNLLAHRQARNDIVLLGDLRRTAAFTQVAEACLGHAPVRRIDPDRLANVGSGAERLVTIPGITAMLRDAASHLLLPDLTTLSRSSR
jgi:predicted dehydrogenase